MTITSFQTLSATDAKEHQLNTAQLANWHTDVTNWATATGATKHQLPLISLARYGIERTAQGSLRHNANILHHTGVVLDIDKHPLLTPADIHAIIAHAAVEAVIHTTSSHAPGATCCRVLALASRPLTADEHQDLTHRLNALLGYPAADESYVPSQSFFIGAPASEVFVTTGVPIDQAVWLPAAKKPLPRSHQHNPPADPLAQAAKRAHDITQVIAALNAIPNDRPDWEFWNRIGMATYAASGGSDEGLAAWESWSARAGIERGTDSCYKRWLRYHKSPPTNIGMGTLVRLAGGQRPTTQRPTTQPGEMGDGMAIGSGFRYFDIPWKDTKLNGKPTGNIVNLLTLLEYAGITVRYNLMTKEPEILIPGIDFLSDNAMNNALSTIGSLAAVVEYPRTNIQEYILTIADQNPYHPVKTWIESRPWDGIDRLQPLIDSLDPANPQAAAMLIPKWMATAIDAAMKPDGVSAQGCLVLQGPQGAGKTRWLAALVGDQFNAFKEGAILDPKDRDSVKQAIRYWITELGELDATFRKADISALKAFITRDHDEFRAPYARAESKYKRKTVFAASVNPSQFLHDDTGNRRYWTIEVGPNFNADHGIDMQQVWAQIAATRHEYVTWLNADELEILNEANAQHEATDELEELIHKAYDLEAPRVDWKCASEVCQELGIDVKNAKKIGIRLTKIFGKSRIYQGYRQYKMPVKRGPFDGAKS